MFISYQNDKIVGYTEQPQDLVLYNLDRVEETNQEYIYDDDTQEYVLKDKEWERRQAEKERERLDVLYMTRSDFFDGFIMAFNLGQTELRAIVENILNSINITDVEIKVALNNFDNALNFYRKHTLFVLLNNVEIPINEEMTLLFTSDIWDKFFDTKDYRELQKAIKVKPEPADTDSDSDTDTDYVHIGDNTDNMEVTTNNGEYVNVEEINENTTNTNE